MIKRLLLYASLGLTLIVSSALVSHAQVSIPYTFTAGTTITAAQVNSNFSTLGTSVLNRTGGTLTGTVNTQILLPSANNTYALGSSSFKYSAAHIVDGSDIAALTAANISAGTAGISISGNAATATNGVVTTGSYSNPAWITALAASKISGDLSIGALTFTSIVNPGAITIPFLSADLYAKTLSVSPDGVNHNTIVASNGNITTGGTINGQTISATSALTGSVDITGDATFHGFLVVPAGAALTGTRFLCINTGGQMISSTTACSGT